MTDPGRGTRAKSGPNPTRTVACLSMESPVPGSTPRPGASINMLSRLARTSGGCVSLNWKPWKLTLGRYRLAMASPMRMEADQAADESPWTTHRQVFGEDSCEVTLFSWRLWFGDPSGLGGGVRVDRLAVACPFLHNASPLAQYFPRRLEAAPLRKNGAVGSELAGKG